MPSVIVADQLPKWYGSRLAVNRVSLEVEAGEVIWMAILLAGRLLGVHGLRAAGLGRSVRLRVRRSI
jgi:hypothetical protein